MKKKFFNVILPYLITGIIGISLCFAFPDFNLFKDANKWTQIWMFLTTGSHNPATWYIPMICLFFLLSPWLLKEEKTQVFGNKSLLFCLLPILLLLPLMIPRQGFIYKGYFNVWDLYSDYVIWLLFCTAFFFPVYVLGMFFAARPQYIDTCYKLSNYLVVLFIGVSILSAWLFYTKIFDHVFVISKIFLTLLLLGLLKHYDARLLAMPRLNKALGTVADYSFSIFFLHGYFWFLMQHIFPDGLFWPLEKSLTGVALGLSWIVRICLRFYISFFGSLMLAMAIKKLLTKCGVKNTRWFIGA